MARIDEPADADGAGGYDANADDIFEHTIIGCKPARTLMDAVWRVREVSWPREVAATVRAFARGRELAWLDSAVTDELETSPARYSLVCRDPVARLAQWHGGVAELSVGGKVVATDASGWRLWRRALAGIPCWPAAAWDVSPGWVGYVGFEMAGQLERLPCSHREDLGLPLLRMGLYDRGIVLDHQRRRAYAVVGTGLGAALGLREAALAPLAKDWERAVRVEARLRCPGSMRLDFEMGRTAYEHMVERALEYIAAGDIYQVNVAQRLRFVGVADPLEAYGELRRVNPAPYAAYLSWAGGAVGSVSPELFLRQRGREVLTRPIKGTSGRTRDPVLDAADRRRLLDSAKDAAELAMIIDLHRNDLGRVCEYGSVRVRDARRVEAHPTVFHTVADVSGRLKRNRDGLDLLAACFPAGSISGVPKIRALEIIDELEPFARGVYTGAIGVLGLDRQMTFNVAIRTLQFRRQTATLHVGGGIVADSDPGAEYEETLAKGRGIVVALSGANGESRMANGELRVANGGLRGVEGSISAPAESR